VWLQDSNPSQVKACKPIYEKVKAVEKWRKLSDRETTRKLAATPMQFAEVRQPNSNYIAIPVVSSGRRNFIPMAYVSAEVIGSNAMQLLPNATLYEFGILSSTMHNAWIRYTAGRLKSDIRYSASIVYNNFPWPDLLTNTKNEKLRNTIELAAQEVLDIRGKIQSSDSAASLAVLYDPLTMTKELFTAHKALDTAVDAAYGKKALKTDAQRVAFLFERYEALVNMAVQAD
jgi:hypothetical protein